MRVHLRMFGVLCSPLLLAAALSHAPLEQVTSTDIEHNIKLEKRTGRIPTALLESGDQGIRQALQPSWNFHGVVPPRGVFSDSVSTCSEAQGDQIAQTLSALKTIRRVV